MNDGRKAWKAAGCRGHGPAGNSITLSRGAEEQSSSVWGTFKLHTTLEETNATGFIHKYLRANK